MPSSELSLPYFAHYTTQRQESSVLSNFLIDLPSLKNGAIKRAFKTDEQLIGPISQRKCRYLETRILYKYFLIKKTVEDGILHIKKLIPFCSVAQPDFFGWRQNLKAAFAPPKKTPQKS